MVLSVHTCWFSGSAVRPAKPLQAFLKNQGDAQDAQNAMASIIINENGTGWTAFHIGHQGCMTNQSESG